MAPRGQAEVAERRLDRLAPFGQFIETRDESEVLLYRQILVEREPLRHVADLVLDSARLLDDVEAEHGSLSRVGRQQAADHTYSGGFAGAVGTEETDDLALGDAQRDIIDHRVWAVALGQTGDVNRVHERGLPNVTSTIWPGCKPSGRFGEGRASIR